MSRDSAVRATFVAVTALIGLTTVTIGAAGGFITGWGFPASAAAWGVGFAFSGAVIERGERGHVVGRILMWAGVAAAILQLAQQVGFTYDLPLLLVAGASFGWIGVLTIVLAAFARFPDGDWAFRGAKALVGVLLAVTILAVPVGLTSPVPYELSARVVVTNPWASPIWERLPEWLLSVPYAGFQITSVAIVIGVMWASLRGDAVHRRQAGWVTAALALVILTGASSAITDGPNTAGLASVLTAMAVLLIPLSVMVAVTRYRLYEIDRIVSRTVTYVVVVAVLGAMYAGLVLVLRSLLPVEGPLPVALSTLAVAFGFFPLLRRVQGVVDRRFFRSRYDAAGVVSAFADELKSTLDPATAAARADQAST